MKLAEALQERADLNRNIEQLKNRLSSNALVQEGEQPVECPENLKTGAGCFHFSPVLFDCENQSDQLPDCG